MAFPESLIVSVSGIRGRVGIDLTPSVVAEFAAAFGTYVREQGWGSHVAIGRDSRPSGPALVRAATTALQSVGCRVSDLGLVPTPTGLLEIEARGLSGGIIVTASHNPKEWNALKLAGPDGAFLTPERGAEFVAGLRAGKAPAYMAAEELGAVDAIDGAVNRHMDRIIDLDLVDPDLVAARGITVALDCARGAGGVILPVLLDRLGCDVVGLELEPDGRFTREPEPIPRNLAGLCELVRREEVDIGMAVDPDVDRLALVDGDGRAIGEDYTLALAARLVLSHQRGVVVANLSTSQIVEEVCLRAGAEYRQAAVGEANVAALMRELGAVVGGEGNGGVILPALHYTRDAPLAMALILQLLAETEASLTELVAEYPQFTIVKERAPASEVELEAVLGQIESRFPGAEIDRRDGVRLAWRDERMWLHLRASGTEPILRLIGEGPQSDEAEVRRRVEAVGALIRGVG